MLWKLSDVESGFLRADSWNNVSLYAIFMFLSSMSSFEDVEYLGHSLTSKTDKNVSQLDLPLKTKEALSMKLLTIWFSS